ncbi:hypothetical protein K440DRAFT_586113 [Wilcoxina mikolae CBS 423.85]|nr:hypothetical protein K440DRAFT_586113 [Wilcoxina mikolae CBS 423.85]
MTEPSGPTNIYNFHFYGSSPFQPGGAIHNAFEHGGQNIRGILDYLTRDGFNMNRPRRASVLSTQYHPPMTQAPGQRLRELTPSPEIIPSIEDVTNDLPRMCGACRRVHSASAFPPRLPTRDCHHAIDCRGCLHRHLQNQLENTRWDEIICRFPECKTKWTRDDIIPFATPDTLARWNDIQTHRYLSNDPAFLYCLRPGCKSGQYHEPTEDPVECSDCHFSMCLLHRVEWHEGQTCAQYDATQGSNAVGEDVDITEEIRRRLDIKDCPRCASHIERRGGCSHMTCKCRTEFCWYCMAVYTGSGVAHKVAHNEGCRWYDRGA